jgi:hypothetical protein
VLYANKESHPLLAGIPGVKCPTDQVDSRAGQTKHTYTTPVSPLVSSSEEKEDEKNREHEERRSESARKEARSLRPHEFLAAIE